MITRRMIQVCLQLVVALLVLSAAHPVTAGSATPENIVPGKVESLAQRLMHDLKQQGYEVVRGYVRLYTRDDCGSSYAVMGSCFGNNPAAPYVIPVVPSWPDEWVDPATAGAFGPTKKGYSVSYRFAPREAIVILGVLPPPAKYFGLQTYLFTREGDFKKESPQYQYIETLGPEAMNLLFSYVPRNPSRVQIFGSLSNSVNNVVIKKQSGAVFEQMRYFIITPDQLMDTAVREALSRSAVATRDIFTEPIPANLGDSELRGGLDEQADDFISLIRYAMALDAGEARPQSDIWRKKLPLAVLRVRDARVGPQPVPYPRLELEPRTAAHNPSETDLFPDLIALAEAVCAKWGQPCVHDTPSWQRVAPLINMQAPPLNLVGPECLAIGMNCNGDTQDTVYHVSLQLPLDDQKVYAIVGALSTKTGNATYAGLGLNSGKTKLGFDNIPDDDLKGSAGGYGSVVAEPGKFFLYYIARDCTGLEEFTGGYCRSVPETVLPCNPEDSTCDQLSLSLRAYMRPGTQRGPDAAYTLSPRVIALHRP